MAFFPKALKSIGIQDFGSAGHDSFDIANIEPQVKEPETYIVGGHGAALQEAMWDSIAEFTFTGDFQLPAEVKKSKNQAK